MVLTAITRGCHLIVLQQTLEMAHAIMLHSSKSPQLNKVRHMRTYQLGRALHTAVLLPLKCTVAQTNIVTAHIDTPQEDWKRHFILRLQHPRRSHTTTWRQLARMSHAVILLVSSMGDTIRQQHHPCTIFHTLLWRTFKMKGILLRQTNRMDLAILQSHHNIVSLAAVCQHRSRVHRAARQDCRKTAECTIPR